MVARDARFALSVAKQMKEDVVAAQGPGADLIPLLALRRDGVLWAMLPLKGEGAETHAAMAATVALSPADEALVIADTFVTHEPGDGRQAAQRFADGDPDTVEGLIGACVRADGSSGQWTVAYRYDGRRLVWAEPEDHGVARGPMADALARGFEVQREGGVPTLSPTELAAQAGVPLVTPVLRPPPRNEPCPCGSGLKAKACCWGPS